MGKYLNAGNDGFAAAVKGIYVDKTEMISFINSRLGTLDKMICVSRPRRFGKSLVANMLCAYYSKGCDSRELFDGLAISKDPSFDRYLNKYNVIYLDITLFISRSSHIEKVVKEIESAVIKETAQEYPTAEKEESLIDMLFNVTQVTGEKFIMIIDEWDALFREAKENVALQKQYIDFLRSLFKSNLTDAVFEGAYMTGILPIKKYGTQSAVSNFREYTMLTPKKLGQYAGFTEEEVKALCTKYHMDFGEMKRWYDGYTFNRFRSIYNPNSVMEAVNNEEFGSYWTRTETYESLRIYIDLDMDGLKEAVVQMLGGESVQVDVETFQNDMNNIKRRDDVITLLIHLGYLSYDSVQKRASIPNEEVRKEFIRAVTASKHKEMAKLIQVSERILEFTFNMDEKALADEIERVHKGISAPIHYNREDSLRSTIRCCYLACEEKYIRYEEMPSGHGYVDIAYVPKQGMDVPVILIELKWNKSAEKAINQVKERDYPYAFKNYSKDILIVGVNYDVDTKKHTCRIEKIMGQSGSE